MNARAEGRWKLRTFGKVKERARPDRVLCDYDFRAVPRLAPMWAVFRIIGLRPKNIRTDRTRRGWHVVIQLTEKLRPAEIVALQACLGSDRRREALNLMRVVAIRKRRPDAFWLDRYNILFERKI